MEARRSNRQRRYRDAGADMIFAEALKQSGSALLRKFAKSRAANPVLANITEFGKTPLFSPRGTVRSAGIGLAFMSSPPSGPASAAALNVYRTRSGSQGTQKELLGQMQFRAQLSSTIFLKTIRLTNMRQWTTFSKRQGSTP